MQNCTSSVRQSVDCHSADREGSLSLNIHLERPLGRPAPSSTPRPRRGHTRSFVTSIGSDSRPRCTESMGLKSSQPTFSPHQDLLPGHLTDCAKAVARTLPL